MFEAKVDQDSHSYCLSDIFFFSPPLSFNMFVCRPLFFNLLGEVNLQNKLLNCLGIFISSILSMMPSYFVAISG